MATAFEVLSSLTGNEITWYRGAVAYKGLLTEISGSEKEAVLTITDITATFFGEPTSTGEPAIVKMTINTLFFNPLEACLHNALVFQSDWRGEYHTITIHQPNPQPS